MDSPCRQGGAGKPNAGALDSPALTESDPKRALTALMALARVADAKVHPQVVARLNDLPWEGLALEWQLVALRTYQLAFIRMGDSTPIDRQPVITKIAKASNDFPELRMEVSRLMIFLNASGIIPQLLNFVVDAKSQEERLSICFTCGSLRTDGRRNIDAPISLG